MKFKRMKAKGVVAKTKRLWLSENKQYRITWRNEAHGIALPPRFFACVRVVRRLSMPEAFLWDFAGARRVFKTFKRAVEECDKHEKAWAEITALGAEQYFITKLEALRDKYKSHTHSIPVFAMCSVRPAILERFSDSCAKSRTNCIELSVTSPSSTPLTGESAGPALPAEDGETSPHTASAKEAQADSVQPAVGTETAPRKSSKPRTKSTATSTKRKCVSTKSAKRSSKPSPKTRRKP